MNKSESINELAMALSKAQGAIKGALKDTANPFFKSKYADLSSVWDACRDQLASNQLSIVQLPFTPETGGIGMETMIMHSSGQWISSQFVMPVTKADAQGVGSAVTYARRYALAAMVGVAPEDDDGEGAVGRNAKPKQNKDPIIPGNELSNEESQIAQESAAAIIRLCGEGKELAAYEELYEQGFSNEVFLAVWGLLRPHSQIRTMLKKMREDNK